MLPKALKSCPKSNKSPNLVTLIVRQYSVHFEKNLNDFRASITHPSPLPGPQDVRLAQPDSAASEDRTELDLPVAQLAHTRGSSVGGREERVPRVKVIL